MLNDKGLIVVLSGPSGAGKDTILRKILKKSEKISLSVSATTRKPRNYERNGQSYHFLTKDCFEKMAAAGEMLEYVEYCGHYYGTPLKPIQDMLRKGIDVILKIEVEGDSQVRKKCPEALHIFVLPPSLKELATRLQSRGTESDEVMSLRLATAKQEITAALQYDYIVVNKDPDSCAEKIFKIIQAEKSRAARMESVVKKVLTACQ